MADYNELEIGIKRHDADSYAVELRFDDPDSATTDPATGGFARFDLKQLERQLIRPDAYGRLLSQSLFADANLLAAFKAACDVTLNSEPEKKLRLRLFIDRSAPDLHSLRWETLRDPRITDRDSWLLTDQRILFSRYLKITETRRVRFRPKAQIRALVAIANPSNLAAHAPNNQQLAPINVERELANAKQSLGALFADKFVTEPGTQVTLFNLKERLRKGNFDILYLVCHGALLKQDGIGVPSIWLENTDGTAKVESALALAESFSQQSNQPRLIVLASCQSAGDGKTTSDVEGALAALGPRLADVGIPAVLAMQGNVSMDTIAVFMPQFFKELNDHGQIDQAIAVARDKVRARPDAWMPTLFSRLRTGRFWSEGGFRTGTGAQTYDKWESLLRRIHEGKCTPIIGDGLLESSVGSTREIAQNWAEEYRFPMQAHARGELPQVAQYLMYKYDPGFLYDTLESYLIGELKKRFGDELPADLPPANDLDTLLKQVVSHQAQSNPNEPHRILAKLPFKVYITTNPDSVLKHSLEVENKDPHVEVCPWNTYEMGAPPEYQGTPSVEKPVVFHLFGQLSDPDSLVLTEDNYFDYLIGVTRNTRLIPETILGSQARTQLLFLGFQMDDWNFRVLLKSLRRPGKRASRIYEHVAVQIDPDEDRLLNPTRARQFLEKYFGAETNRIGIYWGSAEQFLTELRDRWNKEDYGREKPI